MLYPRSLHAKHCTPLTNMSLTAAAATTATTTTTTFTTTDTLLFFLLLLQVTVLVPLLVLRSSTYGPTIRCVRWAALLF